jgi:hypothetical protein
VCLSVCQKALSSPAGTDAHLCSRLAKSPGDSLLFRIHNMLWNPCDPLSRGWLVI